MGIIVDRGGTQYTVRADRLLLAVVAEGQAVAVAAAAAPQAAELCGAGPQLCGGEDAINRNLGQFQKTQFQKTVAV